MFDAREEILMMVQEILGTIDSAPVEAVYRNHPGLPPDIRPCALLLDGDEQVIGTMATRSSGRGVEPAAKPLIVDLTPDIFYAMKTRPAAQHALVGPEMSIYRVAIINALMKNVELARLLGPNGGVFYRGHTTDLKNGMQGLGTQQFFFTFRYVLDPEHLT